MAKPETVVLTNMCMVTDGRGNVLVQDRNDPGWPGIVFPGGHVEPGEPFVESVVREVYEETGITVEDPTLCGVKQFRLDWGGRFIVLLFKATKYHGELRGSSEGEAFWLPRAELFERNTVETLADIVQVMESDTLSEVFYPEEGGCRLL